MNTHYTLLEAGKTVCDQYKARASDEFLSRIARVAASQCFSEVARNVPVLDGKKDLGDLDLVLQNTTDEFIIVEAKNHALPLDVYFRDASATRQHLLKLQKEWEAKVEKRHEYVATHAPLFGLDGPFTYVIVTRDPEVLAHFSSLLVFSINEFEEWLANRKTVVTFEDFYRLRYENQMVFSPAEMELLEVDGFSPKFEPAPKDD